MTSHIFCLFQPFFDGSFCFSAEAEYLANGNALPMDASDCHSLRFTGHSLKFQSVFASRVLFHHLLRLLVRQARRGFGFHLQALLERGLPVKFPEVLPARERENEVPVTQG